MNRIPIYNFNYMIFSYLQKRHGYGYDFGTGNKK